MDGDDDRSRAGGRNYSHDGHDGLDGLDEGDNDEEEEDEDEITVGFTPVYPQPEHRFRSPCTLYSADGSISRSVSPLEET